MTAPDRAVVAFDVRGSAVSVEPHPTGHINDAYLVANERGRYLLQRLNPSVFSDADAVMANVATVTRHLRAKGEPTLTLVATRDGGQSWRDAAGAVWRLYEYIEGVLPLAVDTPHDAALLGRTFGRFHIVLGDLDPASLAVSLPGFHDPARRVAQLKSASESDRCGRLGETAVLVDELIDLQRVVDVDDGFATLPTRVAHNDAKAANVLVGNGTATVVDLDTVMPGSVLWDVGDMVRSSTGTTEEASATVSFDVDRYRALVEAWLAEAGGLLTHEERTAVPRAGPVVTFEQAVRFLTDHLEGDVYFRVTRPGENLDRARNQVELLKSMLSAL